MECVIKKIKSKSGGNKDVSNCNSSGDTWKDGVVIMGIFVGVVYAQSPLKNGYDRISL